MFEELLSKISVYLNRYRIPYMIIGGQAVLLYGEPRLTRDIDITLGIDIDRIDKILALAKDLSLKPIPKDVESFVKETMVLPTVEEATGIRVDFIFSFTPYELEAIKRARTVIIIGHNISFASPEDLIIHKIFAGRSRDLEDVRSVLLKNQTIDFMYIRRWLSEFDTSTEEKKDYLNTFEAILSGISF